MTKAASKGIKKSSKASAKKGASKLFINCKLTIEDNVITLKDFESYIKQNIKVENKKGNIEGSVKVSTDKTSIVVEPKIPFSKRYLKYLTKKYLKKQDLKEFLRVIATSKNTYELKYFQVQNEEAAE